MRTSMDCHSLLSILSFCQGGDINADAKSPVTQEQANPSGPYPSPHCYSWFSSSITGKMSLPGWGDGLDFRRDWPKVWVTDESHKERKVEDSALATFTVVKFILSELWAKKIIIWKLPATSWPLNLFKDLVLKYFVTSKPLPRLYRRWGGETIISLIVSI